MITPLYKTSRSTAPPLRIGVLVDGPTVPKFLGTVLEDIVGAPFVRVVLAVTCTPPVEPNERRPSRASSLIFDLWTKADATARIRSGPLAPVPWRPLLGSATWVRAELEAGADGARLPDETLALMARHELDVVLQLGGVRLDPGRLPRARCGTWAYRFGRSASSPDDAVKLWELLDGEPLTSMSLWRLGDGRARDLELCRSVFATWDSLLASRSLEAPLWETTHFVLWKLHDLHERGWDELVRRAAPSNGALPAEQPVPGNGRMIGFLAPRIAKRFALRVAPSTRKVSNWRVALRQGAPPLCDPSVAPTPDGFCWLEPPFGHFWADPFLVARGDKTFLFFEDFSFQQMYAVIRQAEVLSDGSLGASSVCLDRGHHLSYPMVFEHDGEMFMVPESLDAGTVELYRATSFPEEWVLEKVLFRGNAVDTTPWSVDGQWFFFTTLFDRDDRGSKTMLFVADDLRGAWRLHPASPIASDVRNARGAGPIFEYASKTYRPTQSCEVRYGSSFTLREVVALSTEHYEERAVRTIDSALFHLDGAHTYGRAGAFEVVDGYKLTPFRTLV